MYLGESTDLGNTFWQRHVGKNKKMHLGRGLVKPSTELLIPRPRAEQNLGPGLDKTSVEILRPRSMV